MASTSNAILTTGTAVDLLVQMHRLKLWIVDFRQFQQLRHSCLFLVEVGCLVLLLVCCTTPSRLGHLCYRLSVNGMASTCICGCVLIIYIAFHTLTVPFSTNGQSLKRVNYFGICHANSWFLQLNRLVVFGWCGVGAGLNITQLLFPDVFHFTSARNPAAG